MKRPVRLLLVEDVEEMRIFLGEILRGSGRFEVVGEAGNGAEARMAFERKRPEWVLLDELLPGESSLDLLKDFRAQGARVILMSGTKERAPGRISKPEWDQPSHVGSGALSGEEWLEDLLKQVDAGE